MRRIFLLLLFFFQALAASGQAQLRYEQLIQVEDLKQTLEYLADDMAEGRATGSKGKLSAEQFIRERFRKYGLKPSTGTTPNPSG